MSNEKTGRRGKKRIWGKDDRAVVIGTADYYLVFAVLLFADVRYHHRI